MTQVLLKTSNSHRQRTIPRWRVFLRSLRPFRVIADPSLSGPYDRKEFLAAVRNALEDCDRATTIQEQTTTLWKLEKLGFAYCRHGNGTLDDEAIPARVRPIVHVGLGIASTETAGFTAAKISQLIDSRADPASRLFGFESIGCIWGVKANRLLDFVFTTFSQTTMQPVKLEPWPKFAGHFPEEVARLLAHGYGRTLYFKHLHLGKAIQEAIAIQGLHSNSAIQGIAFAYAMINHAELANALETKWNSGNNAHDTAFQNGLTYALAFWEWVCPGFLERSNVNSSRNQSVVNEALDLISTSRANGSLSVFGVA